MAPEGEEEVFVLTIDAGAETVVNDDGSRTTIIHTYNIVLENASEAYSVYCENNKNMEMRGIISAFIIIKLKT